jgi:hypothetical protein
MAIPVTCPECFKEYNVADEKVGTKFRCKICSAIVKVEELEESEQIKERKKKVKLEAKQETMRQQKSRQSTLKVAGIIAGVLLLVGIGVAAALVPSFRDTLSKVLLAGGITCFLMAWWAIYWTEEELMMRMLIRFFPPALFASALMRFDEVWPFALLALAGVLSLIGGLMLRAAV